MEEKKVTGGDEVKDLGAQNIQKIIHMGVESTKNRNKGRMKDTVNWEPVL